MPISEPTLKLLWSRAHNNCAATGCRQDLTRESSGAAGGRELVILGEQAHIRGRKPGSARHDPGYEDVDGYENLILLCPTHHTEIDKNGGKDFSVDELLKLKSDHEKRWVRHDRRLQAMRAYLAQTFATDDDTRFEQVDFQPSVDAIFVDVAVGALRGSGLDATLTAISDAAPGDVDAELRPTYAVAGGAQAFLHPEWSGGALLVGGPGQGKSTLLQFVCQFHRARLLGKKDKYTGAGQSLQDVTTRFRYPVRVELREYVAWAKANLQAHRGKPRRAARAIGTATGGKPSWPALEQFVADRIQEHSGGLSFDIKDLTSLMSTEPVLLALDGLDEVAALTDREEVSRQIVRTRASLETLGHDVVVLVATRPGAETAPLWSSPDFPQLQLLPLTQGLRLQYFQRWADAAGVTGSARDELQEKLLSQQHELHVKELASTPMQLAILLHLLQRKGRLPQERTALYSQYIQTFLDREQVQAKEPLLGEQRELVERVHEFLAWHLQSTVEEGSSSGSIGREDLRRLLRVHLIDQPDGLDFAQRLFDSFEARVMCLVEREGSFEFQIQSLREYFAAVHIANTVGLTGASKDARLQALLARPYWSNVTRFFVGGLSPSEVKGLRYTLVEVAEERTLSLHPLLRSMAFLLLDDRCFQAQPHLVLQEMVNFIFEGPGLFFAEDGLLNPARAPLRFSDRAGRAQAVEHLKNRLLQSTSELERRLTAWSLARQASPEDAVVDWWWTQFKAERAWLEVASNLGCLDHMTQQRRANFASALRDAVRTGPVAPLLAHVQDHAPDVVQALVDELNAASVTARSSEHTVLGRLVAASRGTPPRQSGVGSRRARIRRVKGELQGLAAIEQAASSISALGPRSTPTAWAAALTRVARVWGGQGWVIRDHVARVPTGVDLEALCSCFVDDENGLTSLVAEEIERRRSAGNAEYWSRSMLAVGGADAVDWIVAALTRAHTSTISKLGELLSQVADALSPAERAVAAEAIGRRGRTTTLRLGAELRLNQFVGSVPLLLLVRAAVEGDTLNWVNKRLATAAKLLHASDFMDASDVAEAAGKVPIDWFRGGRSSVPSGAQPNVQLTGLTKARAREILTDPGQWPTFAVHLAAQKLWNELEKQPPLSEVAQRDAWFG